MNYAESQLLLNFVIFLQICSDKRGKENITSFLLLSYQILHFIRLCLRFLGWAISQRYWTGVGDPYPVCSVFANCHSNWWPDWYPGALPSLGQRSLPPQSPRGELMCPRFHDGQDFTVPPPTPNFLLSPFSWVYTFFMLAFCSY